MSENGSKHLHARILCLLLAPITEHQESWKDLHRVSLRNAIIEGNPAPRSPSHLCLQDKAPDHTLDPGSEALQVHCQSKEAHQAAQWRDWCWSLEDQKAHSNH